MCPTISLKVRLTLVLIVSLTFHFFPVFNVGFNYFISSSFESSSVIWSLIFPDLNSYIIDMNGNFNSKPGGKPNYFWIYLFILAAISYTSIGHKDIGTNICCRHQTLNFPCKEQVWRPSCNVLDVSFASLIFFKDSSNQRPKLFTGSSETVGIL